MKSEFQRGRVPNPQLVVGRVSIQNNLTTIQPLRRTEATLLYQQKVAALIECARAFAHEPMNDAVHMELLRVASLFAENN